MCLPGRQCDLKFSTDDQNFIHNVAGHQMATCKAGCYCGLPRSEKMIKNWNREATTVFANKSSFKITPTIATINMSWNVSKLPCCFSWNTVSMLCMWNYTAPVNNCGLGWATWWTCVYVSCFVVVIERKWPLDMISAVMSSHFLFLYSRSD